MLAVSGTPSVSKDHIMDWIVRANTLLSAQSSFGMKLFKVCGLSNALDGTENTVDPC